MSVSTKTIQDVIDWARSYPALTAVLGNPVAGYGGTAPGVEIANDVLTEILERPFAFKWNRSVPAAFVTNALQQDYSTSITDLGWLENATITDINSTQTPPPTGPLPVVRELMPTSLQRNVQRLSWVYNSQAICGTWASNTTYYKLIKPGGTAPDQPLLQIRDSNGNIQVVTALLSTTGGSTSVSGYGDTGWGDDAYGDGVTVTIPGTIITGTTGAEEPTWGTKPGDTTTDGTVVWTCLDPDGITWRISPLPPRNGKVFQIQPYYQRSPKLAISPNDTWSGIPDTEQRMVKSGFLALAFKAAQDNRADKEYLLFRELVEQAVGADDREPEGFSMYPANFFGGCGCTDVAVPSGTFDRLPF